MNVKMGCSDGAVVRALASYQCGPGSVPRSGVIYELSLLILYSAPRGFPQVLRFALSLKTSIWLDLCWLLISVCSVPNWCSSARTFRHLNKAPFLFQDGDGCRRLKQVTLNDHFDKLRLWLSSFNFSDLVHIWHHILQPELRPSLAHWHFSESYNS